uniref:Cyanobacterial aminoacyl-tRNA synthetase CAAD domain-containing protein n=1 Tax=Manihot esculenta TaxID=3983 RepID=A0A2C9UY60_MANES
MASIVASLPPPAMFVPGRSTVFRTLLKLPVSPIRERQNQVHLVVKAAGESSESSTSLGIVKSVQNFWDKSEDRLALFGLGFAAIVGLWASTNLISAIDKLPVIPSALELIGILYSSVSLYNLQQYLSFLMIH